jgi:hypothetical protein
MPRMKQVEAGGKLRVSDLAYSSTIQLEVIFSSETSSLFRNAQRYNSKCSTLQSHRFESFKSERVIIGLDGKYACVWSALLLRILEVLGLNLSLESGYPKVTCCFPQSLQENFGIAGLIKLGHYRFLLFHFNVLLTNHPIIRHYIIRATDSVINKQVNK